MSSFWVDPQSDVLCVYACVCVYVCDDYVASSNTIPMITTIILILLILLKGRKGERG